MWKRWMLPNAATGWEAMGEGPLLKDANHTYSQRHLIELCHCLCFVSQIFKISV